MKKCIIFEFYLINTLNLCTMFDFLNEVSVAEKTLWYIALPSTIIFVLMLISTLFGVGGEDGDGVDTDIDADVDGDVEHSGIDILDMISFKNLVYFLTFFSWAGISLIGWNIPVIFSVLISLIVSIVFTGVLNMLFVLLLRLQQDSTTKIEDAIGKTGEVYLTIPKGKDSFGKVSLILNGAKRIYSAKTYNEKISTKSKVIIVDVDKSTGTLVVTKDI